jgi:hypothetical protein
MKTSQIKNMLDPIADTVSQKNGVFKAKRFYIYRHGMTCDKFAEQVSKALRKEGIQITILDFADHFKQWPNDSRFEVRFTVQK